jgi:hypothetical protein
MDPNETLRNLILAALDGNSLEMIEHCQSLRYWLRQGGFPPDRTGIDRALLSIASGVE